jgi:aquaporin Z
MATKAATNKRTSARTASTRKTTKTVTSAPATATRKSVVGRVQDTISSVGLWRAVGAEFVGTFLLATVIIAGQGQPIFVLFGLVGIVLLIGAISGAHVNPAITIGAWVTRRVGWLRALLFIGAQVLGAVIAWGTLNLFLSGAAPVDATSAALGQTGPALFEAAQASIWAGKEWYVFFAELLGTAILGFAIANATRGIQDRVASAFTAGLGIFIALMVAVSAASYVSASAVINPAVAISLQAYSWENLWPLAVYAFAPVVGAVVGFVLHDVLRGNKA